MEITLEEIQKKFEELPEDLKWAIMAAKIDDKITAIGQKHGLNVEKLGQLSLETHMVTLGFTHPDKFEDSLKGSLNLSDEKISEIVGEINQTILKDIRERLISLSRQNEERQDRISIPTGEEIIENPNENTDQKETQKEIPDETKEQKIPVTTEPPKTSSSEISEKEKQNKKIMESMSTQKLFGSFQSPLVKTEYTLGNANKNYSKDGTSRDQNVKIPLEATIKPVSSDVKETSPSYSIKEDPYRMRPE